MSGAREMSPQVAGMEMSMAVSKAILVEGEYFSEEELIS